MHNSGVIIAGVAAEGLVAPAGGSVVVIDAVTPGVPADERQSVGEAAGDTELQTGVVAVEVALDHPDAVRQPALDRHAQRPVTDGVGGDAVDWVGWLTRNG